MSSISPQKNFIRVILHKSQLCHPSQTYLSYTLSISYNNSSPAETESILIPSITFEEKNYYFDLGPSPLKKENQITILAITRTMFVIKKTFAKVTIPFTLSKCTNQKQWYFLKDDNDEIVLKVLLALHTDIVVTARKKITHSETQSDLFPLRDIRELSHNNSTFTSPYFYMNKSMINLNSNSLLNRSTTNLTFTNNNSNNLLSIIEKENEGNTSGDSKKIIVEEGKMEEIEEAISDKTDRILEMQKKADNQSDMIKQHEEMHLRKRNVVNKEGDKLKENIKKYEALKVEYEYKNINLNKNIIKLDKDINRFEIQREIDEYDKDMFSNLNYINMSSDIYQLYPSSNTTMTIRTTANASIVLNDTNPDNKNTNLTDNKKINSQKKLKIEYLNSKHLNSTNFTSNCSELNLVNNNENVPITNQVNPVCNVNRHFSPNNKLNSKTQKKNKIIDSLEGNVLFFRENTLRKSKKTLIEFDNIKVIQVKSSSKKEVTPFTNKKKTFTKPKSKVSTKSKLKSENTKRLTAIPHHNIDVVNLDIY